MKVELPADPVLPFEWPQESDWYWRLFRVPARALNEALGYPTTSGGGEVDDLDG